MEIVALVVIYNADLERLKQNIESYINDVSHLYIIDNSDEVLSSKADFLYENCSYIQFGENKGIAYALNLGCKMALSDGYFWILTFDQDSRVDDGYVQKILFYANPNLKEILDTVGVIAPFINLQINSDFIRNEDSAETINVAMTSGCLLNLLAYQIVGGFRDELFIDWVDNDYCYMLKLKKYKIIRLLKCTLFHSLGNCKEYKFMNKHLFYVTHHNYIRHYYKTRNALYLSAKYDKRLLRESVTLVASIFADFVKVLFFEDLKFRKLRFIFLGIKDFAYGRMGRICVRTKEE